MTKYFTTTIGRLRLSALLEGVSLLVLVFVAVPFKYILQNPQLVKAIGPVYGPYFCFLFLTLYILELSKNGNSAKRPGKFSSLYHSFRNILY